ncbi:MAG: RNA-binding protein [Gemmatales bacterium]|nr:MAG: RNA-binding protein [Gemmatales bacterium]
MGNKLYVGNLPFSVSDSELQTLFEQHGSVQSAQVIIDRATGRSKGFGFVEMGSNEEAQGAIDSLNGQDFNGRPLTVNVARPKENRNGGFNGGRGRSGYGRRGY